MWQIVTIVTLLLLMISQKFFGLHGTVGSLDARSLAATGFIILAAFTMGELFKRLKMPALLGYIAAGIVFGPDLADVVLGSTDQAIFGRDVISDLSLINVLTVGVIGTLAGGELKLTDLKRQAGTILTVICLAFVSIIPLTAATVLALATYVPDLIPFLSGAPPSTTTAAALLFGVFGFAMSPTVTLAIMQETRASGRFTSLTLGVVVVAELVLVASFLLTFNLAKLLLRPQGFTSSALIGQLPSIGAEFGWALVLGVIAGVVYILYLRFVAREKLLFTVGIIFGAAAVADMVHAEQLLTFLAAGFVVQNFSKHGPDMIHALEKISLPVFVIYFMTQAAELDLMAFVDFLPLAVILTVVRGIGLAGATKIATRLRGAPEYIDSNLWMAFFSRGSVDIVLAALVAEQVTGWGEDFRAVIMATVVIHITVGPAILKWVYERVGETEQARKAGSQEVAELDRLVDVGPDSVDEPLGRRHFPDPLLNNRLDQINERLNSYYQSCLVKQIETRGTRLKHLVERIDEVRQETFDDLSQMLAQADLDDADALIERVERLHVQFRRTLQPQLDMLEHLDPLAVTASTTDNLLERVRELVDFEEQYRVRMEPPLLEASSDDTQWMSLVKAVRRLRRSHGRGGHRNVPVGRLWRFYMDLALPGYLASAVAATAERNESFWHHLGIHLRRIDHLFEHLVRELRARPDRADACATDEEADTAAGNGGAGAPLSPSVDALPMTMGLASQADAQAAPSAVDESDSPPSSEPAGADSPPAASVEPNDADEPIALNAARAVARRRINAIGEESDELDSLLEVSLQTQRERFRTSVERAYDDFIDGVAKAGTIELPAFQYRPSSRYDEAHRAEARLKSRLGREADLVEGYRGWVVLDHQLVLFLHWFRTYQQRVTTILQTRFDEGCVRQLRHLQGLCRDRAEAAGAPGESRPNNPDESDAGTGSSFDWTGWYGREVEPAVEQVRLALDNALTDFGQGIITRRLMDVLEARVARFSEQIDVLVQNPVESVDDDSQVETLTVPLRGWYFSKLLREAALGLVEFNERAERILRRSQVALSEIRQQLESNLVDDQSHSPDAPESSESDALAAHGLREAAAQTEDLIDQIRADEGELRVWVIDESTQIVRESTTPFLEHRLHQVTREFTAAGQESLAQRSVQPVLSRLKSLYRRFAPIFDQISTDIGQKLAGEPVNTPKTRVRDRLLEGHAQHGVQIPRVYRRLFSPVPLDIPDFYVERPRLERQCMVAVDRWFNEQSTSILISGDRGMGKRTLVHHVLPTRVFSKYQELNEDQLQTVRIDEHVETETDLCESFAPLTDAAKPRTLAELAGQLNSGGRRTIVFVENGDKIYSRTRQGLALCERFLETIEKTSEEILWVIMMGKPAATLLDTAVQLSDYFTHPLQVEPMNPAQIEQVVMSRHQVSGFDIEFDKPDIRYLHRLQHPIDSSDALRHPRKMYFERLGRLSGGNPLLALLYWLDTVHGAAGDNPGIIVEPLPEREVDLIERLSVQKQLILATLAQHHALRAPTMSRVLRVGLGEIRNELNHLRRLGFVESVSGSACFQIRPLAATLILQELRACNLV